MLARFKSLLSRLRQRERRDTLSGYFDTEQETPGKTTPTSAASATRRPRFGVSPEFVLVLLGGVGIVLILGAISYTSLVKERDHHSIQAIGHIRLELAQAHLWFEEAIGGDTTISVDLQVFTPMERASQLARELRDGSRSASRILAAEQNLATRARLADLISGIQQWRELANQRMSDRASNKSGSAGDEAFDVVFEKLQTLCQQQSEFVVQRKSQSEKVLTVMNATLLLLLFIKTAFSANLMHRSRRAAVTQARHLERLVSKRTVDLSAEIMTRRTIEAEAISNLEDIAAILCSIGDGVIAVDSQRRIKRMNTVAEQLTGWSLTEALSRPIEEVFHVIHEELQRSIVAAANDEPAIGRADSPIQRSVLITRHGTRLPIADSSAPICTADGLTTGMVLVFRDVTTQQRDEARLHELNETLEQRVAERTKALDLERSRSDLFLNSAGAGMYGLDLDGRIVFINPAGARIVGYTVEELLGQPMHHKCHYQHADGRTFPREECPIYAAFRDGLVHHNDDDVMWRKDGSMVPIEYTSTPILDEQGRPTGAMVVFRDTTADREQARSLRHAKEAAESASRAKSGFLATMSHELRTPLNGVLGMNELLLHTELTDKQRGFVEASHSSGKLLLQLINDVLDLSKIESGKLELDLQNYSIESLVFDVVEALGPGARQKGLRLTAHIEPAVSLTARCDGHRLRQILVNLIGNAIKFTATGDIRISAQCVRREAQQLRMRFAVSDQGIGIPAARIDRLFCPFTQVDNSTTRNYGGTGLGLAICKQIVELMGGTIGLESQVGTGSTFWFELPLQVTCETNELPTAAEENVMTGARVLVVANEISAPSLIVEHLQAWGCHTELVTTYRDALASVTRAKSENQFWEVALVELPTDASSRRELIELLSRTHGLPVIGFGGTAIECELEMLRELGLRQLLRDPLRPSSLHDALSSTLSAASTPKKPSPPSPTTLQRPLLHCHVLVAEDNRINQMYVTELLKYCGCTCDIATNGEEALAAIQCHGYDLVLMDCQMPEMDGFTATREIRRRETNGQIARRHPIIALTANALKGDRDNCLAAGMDDYLTKPLEAGLLQAMLTKHLSESRVDRTSELRNELSRSNRHDRNSWLPIGEAR